MSSNTIGFRQIYKHISGELFMSISLAKHIKEPDKDAVVLMSLKDGRYVHTEVTSFHDKHPKTGIPRFQAVDLNEIK